MRQWVKDCDLLVAVAEQMPGPKDKLFEREEIRQRVADFKANQQKFQREREDYCNKTIAKARSTSSGII